MTSVNTSQAARPAPGAEPAPPSGSAGARRRRGQRVPAARRAANLLVWAFVAFNLAVLLWIFVNSVRPHVEIFQDPWALPSEIAVENWTNAWVSSGFGDAILNSVFVCVVGALGIVLLSAPAGYILAKTNRRLSEVTLTYVAIGVGVPIQVIIIPLFAIMQGIGLLNSLTGLVVAYIGLNLPFTVFLLAGFFRSMPDELEEAAALDGAGTVRTFFGVVVPVARNSVMTALILNLVWLWSEAFVALVFIQSTELQTLPVRLLSFMAQQQYAGNDYGQLLAGVSIILLPLLATYVWLGRHIVEGMTMGSGK